MIGLSKRNLEEKLNKKIDFLCWPGGGYNDLSIKLSIEAGYKASTIASREKHKLIDNSGKYKRIQRFGTGSFLNIRGNYVLQKNTTHLINIFLNQSHSIYHKNLLRLRKAYLLIIKSK